MAVYTQIDRTILDKFLENYELPKLIQFSGIKKGIENTNYLLKTVNDSFILTIFEQKISKNDLLFFQNVMNHVAKKNIPCPKPIKPKSKKILKLKGKLTQIVNFLPGKEWVILTPVDYYALGKILGQLHRSLMDFSETRINTIGLSNWQSIIYKFDNLPKLIINEIDFLTNNWPQKLPKGIIHADLFPDNLLWSKNKITGILDFYFSCYDTLAYDLAITINAWCFDNKQKFNIFTAMEIINGYERTRHLTKKEKENFSILLRGAALRFYLTRLYDQKNKKENDVAMIKNPNDYLRILKFHQKNSNKIY